jgi:hypothetical protein
VLLRKRFVEFGPEPPASTPGRLGEPTASARPCYRSNAASTGTR